MARPRSDIEWTLIELDYRAGIKPLREIAAAHDITHRAIIQRAQRDDWTRDLSSRIQQKAIDLVTKTECAEALKEKKVTEQQVVTVNAQMQATVMLTHRKHITKYRELCDMLFDELEEHSSGDDKMRTPLPSRVESLKKLTDSFKTLVGLERQAFNIADNANGDANKPPVNPEDLAKLSPADAYKAMLNR